MMGMCTDKLEKIKVLSLGWGVQSTTIAYMCALGEIEKPDYIIHANTGYETTLTNNYKKNGKVFLMMPVYKFLK